MEITFEPDAVDHILASFDVTVDEDGYIVEEGSGDRVTNPDGEDITAKELAVVEEGSTIFVDENFDSLVKHVDRMR